MPDAFLDDELKDEMAGRWHTLPAAEDIARVAEIAGELVGFTLVHTSHANGPLLESLHVAANAQGRGIGRALMAAVAKDLRCRSCDGLSLVVLADNAQARGIYARWGGRESTPFADIIAGQNVQAVRVTWDGLDGLAAL